MANAELGLVVHHLRRLATADAARELTDGELLSRFTTAQAESAFAAIVQRYGRLVLGVCRRILRHEQDAEDAFQATFLVLARKAHSICNGEALAGWLYGVAYHMASRAKRSAARRRNYERRAPMPSEKPASELALRELQAILDEEVQHLPATYRTPFVLCCLEGHSKSDAARRLGWKEGTVSGRLARARKQLQQRLLARGVSLSAALGAVALAEGTSRAAVSPLLALSTAAAAALYGSGKTLPAGLVSPQVTSLVHGATNAMFPSSAKIALFLVVGFCALGATTLLVATRAASPVPPVQQLALADAPPAKDAPAAGKGDSTRPIPVAGQVLDPDGKPMAGARLYWPHLLKEQPTSPDDVALTVRATTGADGRFRFELPGKEVRPEWDIPVIAHADGFGVGGAALSKAGQPADLTLRLVRDNPIRGRVLDTQGKPIAGARVQVVGALTSPKGRLDDFLTAWQREWQLASHQTSEHLHLPMGLVLRTEPTDRDGRFQITGAGVERVVLVEVGGATVAETKLWVINRPGFDPKQINKVVQDRIPAELRIPGQPPLLYGPTFDFVADPTRKIEGIVREAGSGKPLAGMRVHAVTGYDSGAHAVSDAQGRYRLAGLPKLKEYSLHTMPPDGSALIARSVRVPDAPGLRTIPFDIELARGVVVTGRVIDRATGKGVRGGLRFVPLPDNKYFGKPGYDSYRAERLITPTDAQGRFRLVTIPGPNVLMAQVFDSNIKIGGVAVNPYKRAVFDATDRKRVSLKEDGDGSSYFTAAGNSIEFLSIEHACKGLELGENMGPVTCDLFLERGLTRTVALHDPDGKPLDGVTVSGMTASWPNTFRLDSATFTAYALDPDRPRQLVFLHLGRKLAGTLKVRGDEKETPVARLLPTGSVTGRVLDQDGQPVAGVEVDLSFPGDVASDLYRQLGPARPAVRTDREGRFRLDLVVADLKFALSLLKGREYLLAEPRIGLKQVGSGATLELGDMRTKARK